MYKTIWTKIVELKYVELNSLSVYANKCIGTKIRTYGDKAFTIFRGLNVPEDGEECESFAIVSIDCLWEQILSTNIFKQLSS